MKRINKLLILTLLTIIFIIPQIGCGNEEPVSKTSYYLDTVCTIDIYNMDEDQAGKIIDGAFKMCNYYDGLLSKTKENSDIYKINHSNGKATKVDKDTIDVIKKGIYYGDLSKGKFDITIGKVTDLWDFHSEDPKVPNKSSIEKALSCVDYHQINISGNAVTLSNSQGQIDLGGIGKGYICDKIVEYLKGEGVESGVVNLGGNIAVIGGKGNEPFKVGIERPYSDRTEIVGYIMGKDKTLVTSGVYERCFTKGGKTYHHILDVKTGYPAKTDVESVTIIAGLGKSVDCDGLSTTCLTLGTREGKKLIESMDGVEAIFIDKNDKITCTEGADFQKE